MSTWVGVIVETAGRADFWDVARTHGIHQESRELPAHVLVECDAGFDFQASVRLAEAISRDLGVMAIGFVVQTTADVHEVHAFRNGVALRRLAYSRDDDAGWVRSEGTAQPWERVYFFDDAASMLSDDLAPEDVARYDAARRQGDASSVMDLMHPSSTAPMHRVCAAFEVSPDRPSGRWKKRSFLARLFGGGS